MLNEGNQLLNYDIFIIIIIVTYMGYSWSREISHNNSKLLS